MGLLQAKLMTASGNNTGRVQYLEMQADAVLLCKVFAPYPYCVDNASSLTHNWGHYPLFRRIGAVN